MPVKCNCPCPECVAQNCAECSHMNSPEGCDCVGCTCPMHKEPTTMPSGGTMPAPTTEPAPEPPMATM